MWQKLEFSGYDEVAFDFAELLATTNQPDRQKLSEFIDGVVNRIMHPAQGKASVIIIVGCQERNETPGVSNFGRWQSEKVVAYNRMKSAAAWFNDKVKAGVVAAGGSANVDMPPWLFTWGVTAGAAFLVNEGQHGEVQRKENRRVVMRLAQLPADAMSFGGDMPSTDGDGWEWWD